MERDSARRLRGYDDRPTLVEVKNPKTGAMERVIRYDYRELVPLLRHRYDPQNPAVRRVLDRPRDVHMSIDARLQVQGGRSLRKQLQQAKQDNGAAVVLDPATGDCWPRSASRCRPINPRPPKRPRGPSRPNRRPRTPNPSNPYLDRARYGLYPPGSTFKVVTAMAALRKDPLAGPQDLRVHPAARWPRGQLHQRLQPPHSRRCRRQDARTARWTWNAASWSRATPTSRSWGLTMWARNRFSTRPGCWASRWPRHITAAQLKKSLPQSSYGQGQVVASPFQMARVAAAVANGGAMPEGRWITDETNARTSPPVAVLTADLAATLGRFMREVVTGGTGRRAAASVPVAGKTGTAELADAPSHAWFIGFAPYDKSAHRIAFSILVENGVYGGTAAAPAAADIVNAAVKLGLVKP